MATAEVKIVHSFADDTTRDIKIGPLDDDENLVASVKAKLKAFNPDSVKNIYISDNGATCTGVASATITELERRKINLNDD